MKIRTFEMVKASVAVAIWLALCPVVWAQGARSVTLGEALASAVENNALLKAARLEEKAKDGQRREALSYQIPNLTLTENFSRTNMPVYSFMGKLNQESITFMDFDPARLNSPAPLNNWATRLEVTVPLFTGGKLQAANRAAKMGVDAARSMGDFAESGVTKAVTEAFYGSLLSSQAVAVTSEAVKTAEAHRDQVSAMRNEGMVLDSDYLRIQVYTSDLKQQLSSREADASVARAYLSYAMGTDDPVEPAGELAVPPGPLPLLEDAVSAAHAARGDLLSMSVQTLQAAEGVKMAKADYYPQVGLMGAWEWDTERWSDYGDGWMVGVQLRLPVFDGGARSGRLLASKIRENQAQLALTDLKRKIGVEVKESWMKAKAAEERVAVTTEAVSQAKENQRIVELRYKEGMASITDLLDADTAALAAGLTRAQSIYDLIVSRARLTWAMGDRKQ